MRPQASPSANSESSQSQSQSTPNTQKTAESEKQTPDSADEPIKKDIIPPKPPFKFTHSKKWITIEVILLLIVIIAATSYSFYRNAYKPKTPPPPATPTPKLTQTPTPALNTKPNIPVETTDWKTYTNTRLNYSISYPKDWQVRESASQGYPYITISDPIAQNTLPGQTEIFQGALIQINIDNRDPWYTNKDLDQILPLTVEEERLSHYDASISGLNGIHYERRFKDRGGTIHEDGFGFFKKIGNKEVIFDINGSIINYENADIWGKKRDYRTEIEKIISTFHFQNDPSVNTYYDEKFNLSFLYENGWVISERRDPGYRAVGINNPFSPQEEALIERYENPENLEPSQWYESLKGKRYHSELFQPVSEFQVSEKNVLIAGQPDTCDTVPMVVIFVENEGYMFHISQFTMNKLKEASTLKKIIESLNFGKNIKNISELSENFFIYPQAPPNYVCKNQR